MNDQQPIKTPKITPLKVEKKRPTGTKELSVIAKALDSIHEGMIEFMETINRSPEKESEIAQRLFELAESIKETGHIDDEIQEILEDLDNRIFEEKFYTEKSGKGKMRMTDSTRMTHLRAFASEAAKVSSAKFKMAACDYVPKSTVIYKMQRSVDIFGRVLKESLGPQAGGIVAKETMIEIAEVWDGE